MRRLVADRHARDLEQLVVVEGPGLVGEAIEAGWQVETQFLGPGAEAVGAGPRSGTVLRLAEGVIERVASTRTPQQVLAVVRRSPRPVPEAPTLVVVADRVADPGNAGTIVRSAAAAGADAVVFTDGSVDPWSPKVVRASAGSVFRIAVAHCAVAEVRQWGVEVWATSSHRGETYSTVDLSRPVALLVGNEAHGVDPTAAVDGWLSIPLAAGAESLNVAMAATVLLFEAARQRRARSGGD